MKEDYQKAFKKLTLFFLSDPVSFNGQNYQKRKGSGTSDSHFSGYKQVQKYSLFVIYYLTKFDDVMQSSFWFLPKITSANLCKPIDDIINYSTSICPFESRKCGKEGKNQKNFKNEKSFLDKIKNIFHIFLRAIICWKNKNFIKIADTSFNLLITDINKKVTDTSL